MITISYQTAELIPTKRRNSPIYKNLSKEPKEKDVASANAPRFSFLLLETIRKTKPNFRTPNLKSWDTDFIKLVRWDNVSEDRIKRVLSWLPSNEFWKTNILSAKAFRKQFDALELKMEAEANSAKKLNDLAASKDWIASLKTKLENRNDITIGAQSIVFHGGQSIIEIKYTDHTWKEQIINRLRKMNIDIGES